MFNREIREKALSARVCELMQPIVEALVKAN
jgi:hypothetical protein